jgi:hypothetical protein
MCTNFTNRSSGETDENKGRILIPRATKLKYVLGKREFQVIKDKEIINYKSKSNKNWVREEDSLQRDYMNDGHRKNQGDSKIHLMKSGNYEKVSHVSIWYNFCFRILILIFIITFLFSGYNASKVSNEINHFRHLKKNYNFRYKSSRDIGHWLKKSGFKN